MRSPQPATAGASSLRTFVAIELPLPVRQGVQGEQQRLRRQLDEAHLGDLFRWTHPDNLHLTLRFLGDASPAQRSAVEAALAAIAAAAAPFRLAVQKLGAFPSLRKPNIVWLDFGGDLLLLGPLQAQVEAAARAAGFPPEERAFAPHLTIARAQKSAAPGLLARAGDVLGRASTAPAASSPWFSVDQIHLIRSDLRPSGPVYRPLASFDLQT